MSITVTMAAVISAVATIASVAMKIYEATTDDPEDSGQQQHDEDVKNNVLAPIESEQTNLQSENVSNSQVKVKSTSAAEVTPEITPVQTQQTEVFDANQATQEAAVSAAAPVEKKEVQPIMEEKPVVPTSQPGMSQTILSAPQEQDTAINAKSLSDDIKIKDVASTESLLTNNQQQAVQPSIQEAQQPTKSAGLLSPVSPEIEAMQQKQKVAQPTMVWNQKSNKFEVQMK